ncbi:recombination protein O N-terminal domain-containing protein [Mycoplasmopsis alligatoris]|nr:recombination protein O N-terminal domain-containing protein [Mycoplasmopsis alligatoris]
MKKCIPLKIEAIDEKTSILSVLTNQGILKLYAFGLNSPLSKNRSNLIPASIVEIEYFQARLNNKMSKLKKSNTLKSFDSTILFNSMFAQKLVYILSLFTGKNNILDIYEKLIDFVGFGKNSYILTIICSYLLKLHGSEPNFYKCCVCLSTKKIVDFEFFLGGFLCNLHSDKSLNNETLEAYYLLRNDHKKYLSNVSLEINKEIYLKLIFHLKDLGLIIYWENLEKFI